MTKTDETLKLEESIWNYTHKGTDGVYGAFEVTVGYIAYGGKGSDRADYVTIGSDGTIRAYELKTSVADFHSHAKLSWIGHYNYLVLTNEVYEAIKDELPAGVGVIVSYPGMALECVRRSGHHQHSVGEQIEVLESIMKAATRDAAKHYKRFWDDRFMDHLVKESKIERGEG